MKKKVGLNNVYRHSNNVVARQLQGQFIIIPITSGYTDMEEAIFSLNETGVVIWKNFDGKRTLKQIASHLSKEYKVQLKTLEQDTIGITTELLKRGMIVAC